MSNLRAGVTYASGQQYSLIGEGIEWTGVNAGVTVRNDVETIQLNLTGRSRPGVRSGTYAWVHMTPTEAKVIAGALLNAIEGTSRHITMQF